MKAITNYLMGAFVFLSSVFYIPGQNFHDSQKILFQIAAMLFFAIFLSFKPIRQIRNVWVSSYLVYALVVFAVVKNVQLIAITPLINIFLMVVLYYVFVNYLTDDSVVYKAIQGIIAINIIFLLFQFFRIDPLVINDQRQQNTHLVGLFGHPMNMGIFCSLVLPYVFSKSKIWAIPVFICLLVSQSYISIILGVVGLILYLYFTNKKAFKIILTLAIISAIAFTCYATMFYGDTSKRIIAEKITHRLEVNYPLLKAALSNPFHGYGLGTFGQLTPQMLSPKVLDKIGWVDVTWNDYLGCALEMGIGVLFIFYGLFKQTIKRFAESMRLKNTAALFCSLATIPVGIMFHSYMNYINVGVICVALFALLDIKLNEEGL